MSETLGVIVRTLGRDCLPRALASLDSQSRRPDEIVLVDAAGSGRLGGIRCADIPIRIIGTGSRLDRLQAANAALDAAATDWLAFLDEDDELDPAHYEGLFAALEATPGAIAAYSQTRLIASGAPDRVFGGPFDRFALFQSNYLAIHAVMFSRRAAEAGCRKDSRFEALEDWDLWLQVSQLGAFAFSARPTALYHADAGQSGAGGGANLDRAAMLAQREKIRAKWGGRFAKWAEQERYALARSATLRAANRAAEAAIWAARAQALRHGDARAT